MKASGHGSVTWKTKKSEGLGFKNVDKKLKRASISPRSIISNKSGSGVSVVTSYTLKSKTSTITEGKHFV